MRDLAKRLLDVAVSGAALIAAAPLLGAIAVAVRASMGAPVLFRQQRPGLGGKPFTILKFRTMKSGPGSDAERLTRVGQLLRATSLDELPELWNVLRGDMSLVGPRPLLMQYLPRYSPEQARRHDVKPGVTGWAQVNGRNALDWDQKFALDLWYVEHRSLALDVSILARTVLTILRRDGISHGTDATMPEFMGNRR